MWTVNYENTGCKQWVTVGCLSAVIQLTGCGGTICCILCWTSNRRPCRNKASVMSVGSSIAAKWMWRICTCAFHFGENMVYDATHIIWELTINLWAFASTGAWAWMRASCWKFVESWMSRIFAPKLLVLLLQPYQIQVVVVHTLDCFELSQKERPCKLLGMCGSDWSSSV